ncbi:hypothetical protein AB6E04_12200 [Vibrio amylolyticus]|uniref:hypothetical protein n=1 Tax=Vibrio amylolyticus TaxID=2847292 RepID=UPI00354C7604
MLRTNRAGHVSHVLDADFIAPTEIVCGKMIIQNGVVNDSLSRVSPDYSVFRKSVFSQSVVLDNQTLVQSDRRIVNEH